MSNCPKARTSFWKSCTIDLLNLASVLHASNGSTGIGGFWVRNCLGQHQASNPWLLSDAI